MTGAICRSALGSAGVHCDTWAQDYMSAAILGMLVCREFSSVFPAGVVEHLRLFLEQPNSCSVPFSWVQGLSLLGCLVRYLQRALFV